MKKLYFIVFLSFALLECGYAQSSGSITVGGDFDKFYPVTWLDGNWNSSKLFLTSVDPVSILTVHGGEL